MVSGDDGRYLRGKGSCRGGGRVSYGLQGEYSGSTVAWGVQELARSQRVAGPWAWRGGHKERWGVLGRCMAGKAPLWEELYGRVCRVGRRCELNIRGTAPVRPFLG